MKKFYLLLLFWGMCAVQSSAQKLELSNLQAAFKGGERLDYKVGFKGGVISANMANVRFTVQDDHTGNSPTYHVRGTASVAAFFRWMFDLTDTYETWLDKSNLRPLHFKSHIKEGNYRFEGEYIYDWQKMNLLSKSHNIRRNNRYENNYRLFDYSYDGLALFYNMRSVKVNHTTMYPGWNDTLNIALTKSIHTIRYTFIAVENKKIGDLGTFRTLKFSCQFVAESGKMVDEKTTFFIWFSDDDNRLPLYIDFPVKAGSFRVILDSYQNLKYPLNSKI